MANSSGHFQPITAEDLFPEVDNKYIQRKTKRVMDVTIAFIALLALIPIFLVVSLIIKLTSKGPVFFKQQRVGKHEKRFDMYKFRTMVEDAESLKSSLLHKNERKDGPTFKIKNDPRITKVGKFLRKHSIDELPQFWNVLVGEMSVVGPRPPVPSEVKCYKAWQLKRFKATPGLTCYWQVQGENVEFDEWVKSDIEYIENWTLQEDVKLILKTIPVVINGKGRS